MSDKETVTLVVPADASSSTLSWIESFTIGGSSALVRVGVIEV